MNGSNSACSLGNTIAVIAFLAAIGYELQARLIHLKVPIYERHLESTSRLFFTLEFYMEKHLTRRVHGYLNRQRELVDRRLL